MAIKAFRTAFEHQADYKVYVVREPQKADLSVEIVFSEYESQIKIWFVPFITQADKLIYIVNE